MKKLKILYFVLPLWIVLMCIPFEVNADRGIDVQLSASMLYFFRMFVVLFSLGSMVSAFTILKDKLVSQLVLLSVSAFWVVIDYYLNLSNPGSDNLLWLIPMIIALYAIKYKTVARTTTQQQNKR
jgi:hypothetical protein